MNQVWPDACTNMKVKRILLYRIHINLLELLLHEKILMNCKPKY